MAIQDNSIRELYVLCMPMFHIGTKVALIVEEK